MESIKMNTKYNNEHVKILKLQKKEFPFIRKVQQEVLLQQNVLTQTKANLCDIHQGDKICLTEIKYFEN